MVFFIKFTILVMKGIAQNATAKAEFKFLTYCIAGKYVRQNFLETWVVYPAVISASAISANLSQCPS